MATLSRFPELGPWLLTLPIGTHRRAALLRRLGARVGRNVRIHTIRVINPAWRHLTIGDDVYVGAEVLFDLAEAITIEGRASIGQGTMFFTHQDPGDARVTMKTRHSPIVVEPDVFIGVGSIVLAGARIRSGEVVPAGTVVRYQPQPLTPKA